MHIEWCYTWALGLLSASFNNVHQKCIPVEDIPIMCTKNLQGGDSFDLPYTVIMILKWKLIKIYIDHMNNCHVKISKWLLYLIVCVYNYVHMYVCIYYVWLLIVRLLQLIGKCNISLHVVWKKLVLCKRLAVYVQYILC